MLLFNSVQHLIIDEDHHERRIDNFLFALFKKQVPRSLICNLIRTGQVRVNSCRIKPNYLLNINDQVRVPPIKYLAEPISNSRPKIPNKKFLELWQNKLNKSIVFEDQNLLIINKPTKLAVHGGSKVTIGLIEILRNLRPQEHFLELVHRIDQDTSGCLMIAKKRSYLKKLHILLQERKITKTYSALVYGKFNKKQLVEVPLKKIIKSSKEHFVKPTADGGYAKTILLPEKIFKINNQFFSLITAKPTTGKTHQIRVHLAYIGFPIINDDKYGSREHDSTIKQLGIRFDRMFLHAKNLEFVCPVTNKIINVMANYDEDLINVLVNMERLNG